MRIAITGSHGVGKTTLAQMLAKELGLPMISEVAREVAYAHGFETTEQIKNASMMRRIMYQLNVFYGQLKAEEDHWKGYVSDRSVFDSIAYSIYYDLPSGLVEYLTRDAVTHSKHYDLIIYCPIVDKPQEDGFRLTDTDSQVYVDSKLKVLLKQARCSVVKLSEIRENWLAEALKWIEIYKHYKQKQGEIRNAFQACGQKNWKDT